MATKQRLTKQGGTGNGDQNSSSNNKPKKRFVLKKTKMEDVIIALDTENAAKAIGVSAAMMKKMRSEGWGPKHRKVGTKVVYMIKELESFLINNDPNVK